MAAVVVMAVVVVVMVMVMVVVVVVVVVRKALFSNFSCLCCSVLCTRQLIPSSLW
jgi:hypothetical protein